MMGIPFLQQFHVARHLFRQKVERKSRYPLVLMLEPLFRCNLACAGCGKINLPEDIVNRFLTVDECLSAVEECNTPIVSIAGGEPLIHRDMPQIVAAMTERHKFVYLCTNGLLLRSHLKDYTPSPFLTISIHLDGNRERHDALTCRKGVYDQAVEAIKLVRSKGFRVTVNCTLYNGVTAQEAAEHFNSVMTLGVEGITVSPGYHYSRAPQEEIFLQSIQVKQLMRDIFKLNKGRKWRLNHSSLFLDFLAGNQSYRCTPWGNPTRNIFGWQKPCYLLEGEGYAPSFKALMEETDWDRYGRGRNPKCANCMMHSGFEPTAVSDTLAHPIKALYIHWVGPRTEGPMAKE